MYYTEGESEQNYQNLEKEALGTIWGMDKSHYFLYQKEFTLETDQKPLVSIYKKHIIEISPRVQRLIVRSFPYLLFEVVYKKGVDITVEDALNRVTPMDQEDNIRLPIIAVNMITTQVLMSTDCQGSFFSNKLQCLRESTSQDEQLTRLKGYINTGFPCDKKNLSTDLHEFWPHREMLSIKSGPHYLQDQDHSAKGDETRDDPVHTQRPPGQGALPPKGKEHCILTQFYL